MGTLLDLEKRMLKLANSVPVRSNELKKEVARTVHGNLVRVTPVDTSEALSNWVLTAGEPWAVPLPPHYEGSKGSTQTESGDAALLAGEKQLELVQPEEPIYISNNAPHIIELNQGSSKQAPSGFVERAVYYGRKVAKSFGLKLKS